MENCENIRDLILLDLDDMCTPEEQARIQNHLAHCPECASYQKEMQQLTADVQQWGEDIPPLPKDFTQQVMARIQAQQKAPAKKVIPLRRWLVLGASAAALALVFLAANGEILPMGDNSELTAPSTAAVDMEKSANSAGAGEVAQQETDTQATPESGTADTLPQTKANAQADTASAPVSDAAPQTEEAQPETHAPQSSSVAAPSTSQENVTPKIQKSDAIEQDSPQSVQALPPNLSATQNDAGTTTSEEQATSEQPVADAATLGIQVNGMDTANVTGRAQLTPTEDGEEALKQQLSTFPTQEDGYLIQHEKWSEVRQWCEEHQVDVQLEGTEEGDILATVTESTEIILPEPALSTP